MRWPAIGALASALAAAAIVGAPLEILLGLAGPLPVALASWAAAERTFRRRPEALTRVMTAAFAAKMVFFGVYVAVMLGVLSLRPVPFIVSFTSYFIALHLSEALLLKRLFGRQP